MKATHDTTPGELFKSDHFGQLYIKKNHITFGSVAFKYIDILMQLYTISAALDDDALQYLQSIAFKFKRYDWYYTGGYLRHFTSHVNIWSA